MNTKEFIDSKLNQLTHLSAKVKNTDYDENWNSYDVTFNQMDYVLECQEFGKLISESQVSDIISVEYGILVRFV